MGQQEEWRFGTATAAVQREEGAITVRLRGAVTAMVIEALHLRLGCFERAIILVEPRALVLLTSISAVEAAMRGIPAASAGRCRVSFGVAARRLRWAKDFCLLMRHYGLSWTAFASQPDQAGPPPQMRLQLA